MCDFHSGLAEFNSLIVALVKEFTVIRQCNAFKPSFDANPILKTFFLQRNVTVKTKNDTL